MQGALPYTSPMKKSDKKLERSLCASLTDVCEIALDSVVGFAWITHLVNYKQFPQSLRIICIFNTQDDVQQAISSKQDIFLHSLIQEKLSAEGITLNSLNKHIRLDSEEACNRDHNGNWAQRLSA